MEEREWHSDEQEPRSQAMIMLTGLYLFILLISLGSYGSPIAFFGRILEGAAAKVFIVLHSLICLHLFLGIWQRQRLTWYLLLGYNLFEIVNTLATLLLLPRRELEQAQGGAIDPVWLVITNLAVMAAVAWVSSVIYRRRDLFCNRSFYLF